MELSKTLSAKNSEIDQLSKKLEWAFVEFIPSTAQCLSVTHFHNASLEWDSFILGRIGKGVCGHTSCTLEGQCSVWHFMWIMHCWQWHQTVIHIVLVVGNNRREFNSTIICFNGLLMYTKDWEITKECLWCAVLQNMSFRKRCLTLQSFQNRPAKRKPAWRKRWVDHNGLFLSFYSGSR